MSNIDDVEKEAQSNLSGDDLTAVMSSAETTRATFTYFNAVENDGTARRWGWIKRRAQKIASLVGVGTLKGAAEGLATGTVEGVIVGAVAGAVTGVIEGVTK